MFLDGKINYLKKIILLLLLSSAAVAQTIKTDDYVLKSRVLVDGLDHPWSMVWLNQGLLISERNNALQLWRDNRLYEIEVPEDVHQFGQGGLLDLETHPDYGNNGWIYLTYAAPHPNIKNATSTTALARFRLKGIKIIDWQRLFLAKPWLNSDYHFGSRIEFDDKGYLYFTIGDRGKRDLAQKLEADMGSVIRLFDDGRIPKDNPFAQNPAVYSYGHRNPQGMKYFQGELWLHEHGPRGGDELNLITKGGNYGWPVISYGREYLSHLPVSKTTHKSGMQQPKHYWTPSIAPSGLSVYEGQALQKWRGNLLIGSLKFGQLLRFVPSANRAKFTQHIIIDDHQFGRIRSVKVRAGEIYFLTDKDGGALIKLSKAPIKR